MTDAVPIHIVLGIDIDGKPHASRFEERDAAFIANAARLMGFHAVRVDDPELRALAERLPAGKIFATGRAFVPFVGRELFDKLATLVEGGIAAPAKRIIAPPTAPKPADPEAVEAAEAPWAKIDIGAVVLAAQPQRWDGWFESVVVAIAGDVLTLRWRDAPQEPAFSAPRSRVGLLPPGQR